MSTRQIAQAIVRRAFAPYDPASALGEQYERVVYAVEVALTKETPVEMEGDLLADLAIYKVMATIRDGLGVGKAPTFDPYKAHCASCTCTEIAQERIGTARRKAEAQP